MATAVPRQWRDYFHLDAERYILEAQQAHLEGQLAKISQDLAAARRRDAILHNEKSPIFRLTNEVLSNIFLCLHSTQTLDTPRPDTSQGNRSGGIKYQHAATVPTTRRTELDISHVCQRWRQTSLNAPALWGTFWCNAPRGCAGVVAATQRLKEYLARSAPGQDLELYFDFTLPNPQPESAMERERYRVLVSEMLNLTVPHARRWKNLTIIANDATRRVSLASFQRAISCISAPKLERLVVCVGSSYYSPRKVMEEAHGWEDQVLLLRSGDDEAPCPRLKYVKLDGAGLGHCRPRIQSLAHLVLELGPPCAPPDDGVAQAHSFQIDWPVFLSSDVLRISRLETLSLHEGILNKKTFPYLGKRVANSKGDIPRELLTVVPTLKHLRIGDSFDGIYSPTLPTNTGSFLLFFLRFVFAPALESLAVCGYLIDSNPWDDTWATDHSVGRPAEAKNHFDSLKTLILSDVYLGPTAASLGDQDHDRRAPFTQLVRKTSNAQSFTISQSQAAADQMDSSHSLVETAFSVAMYDRQGRSNFRWPHVTELSINIPATTISQTSTHEGLKKYMGWCKYITSDWASVDVIRIPPQWLDIWLARLDLPAELGREVLGGDNYVWERWLQGIEDLGDCDHEGSDVDDGEESEGDYLPPFQREFLTPPRIRPVRIEPIAKVALKFWPPGGGSTAFNTLPAEQFRPFKEDLSRPLDST